ncbi:hypothetical protein SL1157_A0040 [Ruegeria lacuscaerulensis ITI-1157]|nr:hypothetical protein SL1157_A0040 [Ruegeria lacuscaerulensis ITI-1157]
MVEHTHDPTGRGVINKVKNGDLGHLETSVQMEVWRRMRRPA